MLKLAKEAITAQHFPLEYHGMIMDGTRKNVIITAIIILT